MPRKPGAKAIVVHQEKICLVLRDNNPAIPNPNKWNTPGGGIDDGETPREAIIRELKEEINLDATDIIETGVTTYTDGSIVYRYFVPVTDEQFKTIHLVSEGQKLAWFTFDEALALVDNAHLATYLETHASDIRDLLSGKRDFVTKHETLNVS
jgi:8-oxo-dGTP diphosphatase